MRADSAPSGILAGFVEVEEKGRREGKWKGVRGERDGKESKRGNGRKREGRKGKRETGRRGNAVFTCIGALGTPAERGPSLQSIYRVSSTQYTRLSKALPVQ